MKATNQQIQYIESQLVKGLSVIRKQRDRLMMRDAVMRIRQLRGILEVRGAKCSST